MDMVHTRDRLMPVAGVLVYHDDHALPLQSDRNLSSSSDAPAIPVTRSRTA